MALNYDETEDFDEEATETLLREEAADTDAVEEDVEEPDAPTALSPTFLEVEAADDGEEPAEPTEEPENSAQEADTDAPETDEERLARAIEAYPIEEDEDFFEIVDPSPLLHPVEVELFRPQEQDNLAYADAVKAYYEEKDYQRAIDKFEEALENEAQHPQENATDATSIEAKARYWQAEAYVKVQDIPQALVTFENLIQKCPKHYLSLAAQRRTAQLTPADS